MVDRVGQHLGNYQLERLIGRGGFADVYLGRHQRLQRLAAIKVLHAYLSEKEVENFQKEAQVIAALDHPNIVRILDFDVQQGVPFLVMDYLPNGTLRERHGRGERVPLPTIIIYIKQIADALQYAHDQRLIHRDIKPENMLIGRRGEIILSDFGIAAIAHSTSSMTAQASLGTIPYMAPEQIQAQARVESDQYALGIVVYEWLCGERPFDGSYTEVFAKHLMTPPPALREKVPTLSVELEQVVMIALAKDYQQRFGSVKAFARALEHASRATLQGTEASFAETLLPQPLSPLPPTVLVAPVREEPTNLNTPPMQKIPPTIMAHPPVQTPPSTTTPPLPLQAIPPIPVGTILYTYRRHANWVYSLAWSPDGKRIASASMDKTVQVWDAAHGTNVYTHHGHANWVYSLAWSPDGKCIVSGSDDKTVQVWDVAHGTNVYTHHGPSSYIWSLAWSPDGRRIASVGIDGEVQVWDATNGGNVFTYHWHSSPVYSVAWSPDGKRIASGSMDRTVQVWDATDSGNAFTYHGHSSTVYSVGWSPDGQRIASASDDNTVQVWDVTDGGNAFTYHGHSSTVYSVAWSPDGKRIASGGKNNTVQVWDAADGMNVFTYRGHSDWVHAVVWSPDGKRIASGGYDKTVQVWSAG